MNDNYVEQKILEGVKPARILLIIIDVFIALLMLIILSEGIVPIIVVGCLFIVNTLLIVFLGKVQKNPLKYRKMFFNLGTPQESNTSASEINFSMNKTILDGLSRAALADLLKYKIIEDSNNVSVEFGYAYEDVNGKLNSLYKVLKDDKIYYYVCDAGSVYRINFNEDLYNNKVSEVISNHSCLQTTEGADTKQRDIIYNVKDYDEVNLISDRDAKMHVFNLALKYLNANGKISDYNNLNIDFGYIYSDKNRFITSLFKVNKDNNVFYFLLKDEFNLELLDWSLEKYESEVLNAKKEHPCLNQVSEESDFMKLRREKNNSIIRSKGIVCHDNLLCNSDNRSLKDLDTLCKKAISSLLVIQVACDINNNRDVDYSINFVNGLLDKYGVRNYLNSKEKRIMDKTYSKQDALDMDWEYETYWSLCWVLGLIDDISDGGQICDCDLAVSLVFKSNSYDEFKRKCKLRSREEVLDMEDLYFRYYWAINEKKVNPDANISNLNESIVVERYRGLQWVLSNEDDWYDIHPSA